MSLEQLPASLFLSTIVFLDGRTTAFLESVSKKIKYLIIKNQNTIFAKLSESYSWIVQKPPQQEWKFFYRKLMYGIIQTEFFVAGGSPILGEAIYNSVECLKINTNSWRPIPSLMTERDAVSIVADHHTNRIFALGGWNDDNTYQSMECYELSRGEWRKWPSMSTARSFLSAISDGKGHLFATGGGSSPFRGANCYKTVEIFNLERKVWRDHSNMLYNRCGHVSVLGDYGSSIYCLGGYAGGTKYLSTVERLDIQSDIWQEMPRMKWKRTALGAGFGPDGCIYAVGGSYNGSDMLSTAERLDPRTNKWETITPMNSSRGYTCATFGTDGYLYVAGGYHQYQNANNTVERLDIRAGLWEIYPASLLNTRVNAGMTMLIPMGGGQHIGPGKVHPRHNSNQIVENHSIFGDADDYSNEDIYFNG